MTSKLLRAWGRRFAEDFAVCAVLFAVVFGLAYLLRPADLMLTIAAFVATFAAYSSYRRL